MHTIQELNQAILNFDIQAIQDALARISDADFHATFNDTEMWDAMATRARMTGIYVERPFDLVIHSTIKRFLETGDNSSIQSCIEILNLLRQRGWNARLDKGTMRKVYSYKLCTTIENTYMNVRDFPNFNDAAYASFTRTLIDQIRQRFVVEEKESLDDYLKDLQRENQLTPNHRYALSLAYFNQISHLKPIVAIEIEKINIQNNRRSALAIATLPFQEEVKDATNESLDYENSIKYSAGIIKSLGDKPALFNHILSFLPAMNAHATKHLMEFVNPQFEEYFGTEDSNYLSCEDDETDYQTCDESEDFEHELDLTSKSKFGN